MGRPNAFLELRQGDPAFTHRVLEALHGRRALGIRSA